jgi:hypothetical protein
MYTYLNIVIQPLYIIALRVSIMIFHNEWGDILIENFVSSKPLLVAKHRSVAITPFW